MTLCADAIVVRYSQRAWADPSRIARLRVEQVPIEHSRRQPLGVDRSASERTVLDRVSITLHPGEIVGVLGDNGAGKSTLLSALLGFCPLHAGRVTLDNRPLADWRPVERARAIAAVLQREEHAFSLTARTLVGLGRFCHQSDEFQDKAIVDEALRWADAGEFAHRSIHTLSGGERQRVLLARARAQQARYWLLDEPTDGLDLRHQLDLAAAVQRAAREEKIGVLWVMHDPNFAERVCDRVCVLSAGTVGYLGATQSLTEAALSELFSVQARAIATHTEQRIFWFDRKARP